MSQAVVVAAAAAAAGSSAGVAVAQDMAPLLPFWAEVAVAVLVLSGAFFALLGSLGLMRLQSYFERVHAPSIIATMGCWLILWAAVIFFSAAGHSLALHMMLVAVFIAVTVPITTIFLMRAALFRARRNGQADVPMSLSRRGDAHLALDESAPAPTVSVPRTAVAAAVAVVSASPTQGSRSARTARRKHRRR